ncbi:MAG: hypothetical protein GF404_12025 [candidate division Zixibacteria bacterium]|jgi:4-carboxymuconolactone decarboxylase|nr:hypothetical protein [candidate division Zixibacteria bacterium]
MSETNRYLIKISACLAAAKFRLLKQLISEALENRVPPQKIYEALLQAYLFLGYPKAIEGLKILREICDKDQNFSRINFSFRYWSEWKIRGRVLCEKVYGSNYQKLMNRMNEISPEMAEWMIVEGYGKVLARGVLPGVVRELCSVAILLVNSDINQLHSHMRGAKNLGATRDEITEAMQLAADYCSKQKLNRVQKLFNMMYKE